MNLHRARRVAGVLVASQVRSGRAGSDPRSFFGQPWSLLVYDVLAFAVSGLAAWDIARLILQQQPSVADSAPGYIDPLLPVVCLGVVLVAGVLFELTTTSRFATSDTINWLPVPPREYVLASAMAVAYSYSITASVALGAGLGVAVATGTLPAFGVAAVLSLLGLFEAGLLIEMLRSTTQRASGLLGRSSGRAALVLRAAVLLVVILAFQLLFNPVLLFAVVGSVNSLVTLSGYVPLLWGTRAAAFALGGEWLYAAVFATLTGLLVGGLVVAAGILRTRFWSVTAGEIRLEAEGYGRRHPLLTALGFGRVEASITSKDLRGLVRRRELLPMVVLPLVLGVVGVFGLGGAGGGRTRFSEVLWVGWLSGFYALLLASTSIGQERRGFQNLYALPIAPAQVFWSKAGTVLVMAVPFGCAWVVVSSLVYALPPIAIASAFGIVALTVLEGSFVGLVFAARFSDFQERPRPQYLQPSAMLAAMLVGLIVMFATIIPIDLGAGGAPASLSVGLLAGGLFVGLLTIAVGFALARGAVERLLREIPF
ncbi:MAG TPA: hypothetical protein VGV89_04515 [Thermoplasmata archaeon]|nr:hypothetical protein [Thermoplasmata archaeon]